MNTHPTPQRQSFISLRLKLLVGFTLLFSVVFAVAFYWFYAFATESALNRIRADLLDTLKGAAAGADGDELAALARDGQPNAAGAAWLAVSEDDENEPLREETRRAHGQPTALGFSDDPRYARQMDYLEKVHSIEPRAWPYTFVRGVQEAEIIYVTDIWARYNPEKAAPLGFHYVSSSGLQGTSYRGLSALALKDDLNPYTDQWGEWVTAIMPITNAEGENVAAIGVDFEADYVYEVQRGIQRQMLAVFGITYGSLFVLVFLVSRVFTRPIVALTQAAERIGEGDYAQDLSSLSRVRFPDEIGTLAEVFEIMVAKVSQREQTLRRKVEELQIEIDEAKRHQQVSEIVDTGFFQELQEKARTMRRRRMESQAADEAPAA